MRVRCSLPAVCLMGLAGVARAALVPFPAGMAAEQVPVNGTTLQVRIGGSGPAVLLIHGFGDTGEMWAPFAVALIAHHRVIVPDLRGFGQSAHPSGGYDKLNQGKDMAALLDHYHIERVVLVTHDIGNMVGYTLAAQYPQRILRWAAIDAPLPGIGPWEAQLKNPKTWHFNFYGPDEERLVSGRERIYLDRFWNELSAHPEAIDEATRQHYAQVYAQPQAIHDAFENFKAFRQDALDNQRLLARGKLQMPVLAVGGEASYGTAMVEAVQPAADHVRGAVIRNCGHWIMEEQPDQTVRVILPFIEQGDHP